MTDSLSLEKIKNIFSLLGRAELTELLNNSNLSDRELEFMIIRFVRKCSLKECSEKFGISENAIAKMQSNTVNKLLKWFDTRKQAETFLETYKIKTFQINYK